MKEYGVTAMFIGHLLGMIVTLCLVLQLKVKVPASKSSAWQVAGILFKDRRTTLFFFATFVLGQGFGVVSSFLFLL